LVFTILFLLSKAVSAISDVAQGKSTVGNPAVQMPYDGPGELAAALDDFDERIIMDPLAYSEIRTRPSLEERLESIISGAALMVHKAERL
jgi:catenin alpha